MVGPRTRAAGASLARLWDVLKLLSSQAGPLALGPRQRPGNTGRYLQVAEQVVRRGVGLDRLGMPEVQRVANELPARHVVPVHEGHRHAGPPGPPGAADAVQVGLI